MWLINVHSRRLEQFLDCRERAQAYAILSHTWGKEEDEVQFHEIHHDNARQKKGYRKIDLACCEAAKNGHGYVWIDTCCINKDSSVELSEAINSMFKWYKNAAVCYAYLEGVDYSVSSNLAGPNETIDTSLETVLKPARWFTRSWTLQELIAPREVLLFDQNWRPMGSRTQLSAILERITGIDLVNGVDTQKRRNIPAAKKLSWAAFRITTREEDRAYSLFGLFDVFLPLHYGEGPRAFQRLQEEILKTTNDQSVLAWQPWLPQQCSLLLSPTCYGFRYAGGVLPRGPRLQGSPFDDECELKMKGIRLKVPVAHQQDHTIVALNCKSDAVNICELRLQRIPCPSYRSKADSLPIYWVYRDLGPSEKHSQSSCWLKPNTFLEDWQDGLEWEDLWILRCCKGRCIAFYTDGQVDIAETLPQAHWFNRFGQMMFPFHEYDAFCDSNERRIVVQDNTSHQKRTLIVPRNNAGWITVHWGQISTSNEQIPSTSAGRILDGAIPTLEWPVRADMVKRSAFNVSEIIVVLRRAVPQPGSLYDAQLLSTTSQSHIIHHAISTKQLLSRRDLVASEADARHMLWDEVDRNTIFEGT